MKLEVKYIFLTSSSGANFYIFHFPESMEVRKILTLDIKMQYNLQTREDIFCIFKDFHVGQRPTCPPPFIIWWYTSFSYTFYNHDEKQVKEQTLKKMYFRSK